MTIKSRDVPSQIGGIYDRFQAPPNLQMHMVRVASMTSMILDHWKGLPVSRDDAVAASLLHDMGNIVKFDLSSQMNVRILGKEARRLDFWKGVRADTMLRYGRDDHMATMRMVGELEVSERVNDLVGKMGMFSDGKLDVTTSLDQELKVCCYSDCRVGPFGIITLNERFEDLMRRYAGTPKAAIFAGLSSSITNLEKQIFENTNLSPEKVNEESVKPYMAKFIRVEY